MSKIVLVTGASRGIGLEAAKHFSKEGYKVIGTSRGDFNLGELIGDDSAISFQLDLTSKESIKIKEIISISIFRGSIKCVKKRYI